MTADDLAPMLAIERASYPSPWTPAMFLRELEVPFSRVVVARSEAPGAEILGYLCRWIVADEVQILNVTVAPHARRRGIATAMVTEVCREAEVRGLAALTLEVRRANAGARALYAALGFVEVGVRPGYYARGEDALVMRRVPSDA